MNKINKYSKYIKPILVLEKYNDNPKVNEMICSIFADFLISNSDFVYEHLVDNVPLGCIAGTIKHSNGVEFNVKGLKQIGEQYPDYKDLVEFQIRIMDKIFSMDDGSMPEVNCLASLFPGNGKILIKTWEDKLIQNKINQYHLFSDENCNYEWYIKNGFKLVEKATINISDLKSITTESDMFHIYHFIKKI